MASGHPLLRKKTRFAAAAETTAGTAVSISGTDAAMIVYDPSVDYEIPVTKRPKPGNMVQLPATPQARKANIKATVEMMGLGSSGSPLWATTLLAASGFVNTTNTFTPVTGSSSATSLTCGVYRDGRLKSAAGCMFSWAMKLADGMPGMIDFTGQGCWVAPSSVALITPTYPTVIPPTVRAITFTIGGTTYTVPEIDISCDNTLYLREDVTATCGYKSCVITDRSITVKVSPESLALGTKDWFADQIAGTEVAISIVLGASASNIITIAIPKAQLESAPQDGDRNGTMTDELVFQCNANTAADDSEISIAFS